MKKAQYSDLAERLYVADQMTFEAIAAELNISDRTIRTWAQEGHWAEKRATILAQRTALHEDLYCFARKLVKLISLDLDRLTESAQDDPARDSRIESRINSMTRLLDKLPKARGYEQDVRQEQKSAEQQSKKADGDQVAQKLDELLGA